LNRKSDQIVLEQNRGKKNLLPFYWKCLYRYIQVRYSYFSEKSWKTSLFLKEEKKSRLLALMSLLLLVLCS